MHRDSSSKWDGDYPSLPPPRPFPGLPPVAASGSFWAWGGPCVTDKKMGAGEELIPLKGLSSISQKIDHVLTLAVKGPCLESGSLQMIWSKGSCVRSWWVRAARLPCPVAS